MFTSYTLTYFFEFWQATLKFEQIHEWFINFQIKIILSIVWFNNINSLIYCYLIWKYVWKDPDLISEQKEGRNKSRYPKSTIFSILTLIFLVPCLPKELVHEATTVWFLPGCTHGWYTDQARKWSRAILIRKLWESLVALWKLKAVMPYKLNFLSV